MDDVRHLLGRQATSRQTRCAIAEKSSTTLPRRLDPRGIGSSPIKR